MPATRTDPDEELYERIATAFSDMTVDLPETERAGYFEFYRDVLKKCREVVHNEIFKDPRRGAVD